MYVCNVQSVTWHELYLKDSPDPVNPAYPLVITPDGEYELHIYTFYLFHLSIN